MLKYCARLLLSVGFFSLKISSEVELKIDLQRKSSFYAASESIYFKYSESFAFSDTQSSKLDFAEGSSHKENWLPPQVRSVFDEDRLLSFSVGLSKGLLPETQWVGNSATEQHQGVGLYIKLVLRNVSANSLQDKCSTIRRFLQFIVAKLSNLLGTAVSMDNMYSNNNMLAFRDLPGQNHFVMVFQYPNVVLCKENLVAFMKLLRCRDQAGLASFFLPVSQLLRHPYLSLHLEGFRETYQDLRGSASIAFSDFLPLGIHIKNIVTSAPDIESIYEVLCYLGHWKKKCLRLYSVPRCPHITDGTIVVSFDGMALSEVEIKNQSINRDNESSIPHQKLRLIEADPDNLKRVMCSSGFVETRFSKNKEIFRLSCVNLNDIPLHMNYFQTFIPQLKPLFKSLTASVTQNSTVLKILHGPEVIEYLDFKIVISDLFKQPDTPLSWSISLNIPGSSTLLLTLDVMKLYVPTRNFKGCPFLGVQSQGGILIEPSYDLKGPPNTKAGAVERYRITYLPSFWMKTQIPDHYMYYTGYSIIFSLFTFFLDCAFSILTMVPQE